MKTTVRFLLAFAMILTATAIAGSPEYAVKAPDGWKKNEKSAAPEHYMKNGVSLMLTIDSAPFDVKTPDAYVDYVKKQFEKSFKDITYEPVKKVTINGNEARELRYIMPMSGMKMKYDVVFIPKLPKVYTLTAGGLADGFDSMNADYQAFFKSFKLK